jgi:hypothetical protein
VLEHTATFAAGHDQDVRSGRVVSV